jgi:hypothetical protein
MRRAFSGLAALNPSLGISEDSSPEDFSVCFFGNRILAFIEKQTNRCAEQH